MLSIPNPTLTFALFKLNDMGLLACELAQTNYELANELGPDDELNVGYLATMHAYDDIARLIELESNAMQDELIRRGGL